MPKKDLFKETIKIQNEIQKENEIQKDIITLMNYCREGYTGEWDPTGEGRDGFVAMYEICEKLAQTYGIDVRKAKEI